MQNTLLNALENKFNNLFEVKNKALNADTELLEFLLNNKQFQRFFIPINKALVFKQQDFLHFLDSRILEYGYTKYKNTIGLSQKYENKLSLLKQNSSIVLNFPFKDCILKGGQTKDSDKSDEIFFNEILASDEIDVLKSPKVLCNFEFIGGGATHL